MPTSDAVHNVHYGIHNEPIANTNDSRTEDIPLKDLRCKDKCFSLFSLSHLKDAFSVTFKQRPGQKRKYIIIVLLANFITTASAANVTLFLFLRASLNFNQVKYTVYLAINGTVSFCTQTFVLPFMKKYMGDIPLALCGAISETVSRFQLAACRTEWLVWLVPITSSLSAFQPTGSKSYLVGLLPPDEIGKIYAVQSFLNTLSLIVAPFLYNMAIYPASVAFYPGLSFFVSGVLCLVPLSIYVYLFVVRNKTHTRLAESE